MAACHTKVSAQEAVPLKDIPLSLKVVVLCEKITSAEKAPLMLMDLLFGSNGIPQNKNYYSPDFKRDSFFLWGNDTIGTVTLSQLSDPVNSRNHFYEISVSAESRYITNRTGRHIKYDPSNRFNISFEELNTYLSKPVPKYPAHFQPKETKYYYYEYTNPVTGNKAVVEIESFNPPGSGYNTISNILIANDEVHPVINYTPLRKVYNGKTKKPTEGTRQQNTF